VINLENDSKPKKESSLQSEQPQFEQKLNPSIQVKPGGKEQGTKLRMFEKSDD
jgi:hypothetical protein